MYSAKQPSVAIEVQRVTRLFGSLPALQGVDLSVPAGNLFGLIGPNGAGKTTLIKAMVGALRPTSGRLRVAGFDPLRDKAQLRRNIGYMPQSPALYEDLSARTNVEFFAAAHRVPSVRQCATEALGFADLLDRADDPVFTLSGGLRRRVSLACALVHSPKVLFLDEPTAAVDPQLRSRMWLTFREIARGGVTLFISTHLMDEALLCDTVAILRAGKIAACDDPYKLLRKGRTRLTVWSSGTRSEQTIGGRPEDLAAALAPYGLHSDISGIEVRADSLEDVMLALINKGEER